MAGEENSEISDKRIGEALIKEVIEDELRDASAVDVPPLTPLAAEVQTEQEQKIVTQLGVMIRIVGDKVKDDQAFQDAIDGMAAGGASLEMFKTVADKVFEGGITWENIAVLFYVAGRLAVRMVEAHLPQSVLDILKWTVEFFRKNLLDWIREHGGWLSSFSALAASSIQGVSSASSPTCKLMVIFISGLAIGSFITWRLVKRL